jgi:hydroxypyruvate reductase
VILLGIGKAAEPMVRAAAEAVPEYAAGLVVTKKASGAELPHGIELMEAAHPVPDARSVMAGRAALDLVARLSEKDLLICLISGGGSALVTSPRTGIGLRDIQLLTASLLAAGATIEEINTLRRRLDGIKGGGLARATRARVISLLLSDVIGDRPGAIASGPTAPDTTTGADALAVLTRYGIPVPPNVYGLLSAPSGADGLPLPHVSNHVIANAGTAVQAALAQASVEGLHTERLRSDVQGEARLLGRQLAARLRTACAEQPRPFCMVAAGETTVTLHGEGKGGRNLELALSAVTHLGGLPRAMLISLATDGEDGPTDAAGAVATGETHERGTRAGLNPSSFLARNDSYNFFAPLGDLLKPGYTGTNVNDLMFLIGL